MKTEIYSWRVSAELKSDLEKEARRRRLSLSAVLNLAARAWLKEDRVEKGEAEEQLRLHEAASKCVGAFAGGDPLRSENARETLRKRLRKHHDR